ncbi:cbb3-type cytochrome c oxidase subunit II [Rhodanobacter lindaniclasticus]
MGSFIYVIALSIGGTVQGLDWVHGHPFIQSVVDMQPYYVWRGVGGMLMFLSPGVRLERVADDLRPAGRRGLAGARAECSRGGRRMKKLLMIAGGALGIYIVIVMLIAVIPAIDLSMTPADPEVKPLTALQAEGRDVFVAEGCSMATPSRYGRYPRTRCSDGRPRRAICLPAPELLGSERTGPDLTNVGASKPSDVWQYIHLFDPRAVVPESIMPNFKFLFRVVDQLPPGETAVPVPAAFAPATGKVIPTQQAKALVAYLLSLKQTPIPGYTMNGGMGGATTAAPAATTAAAPSAPVPAGAYHFDPAAGPGWCCATVPPASAGGEGIRLAAPAQGQCRVDDADPTLHIDTVFEGAQHLHVGGVAVLHQRDAAVLQPAEQRAEIADIINHERSSWGNQAKSVTPAEVAAARAKAH